jgi:hypothetical protein
MSMSSSFENINSPAFGEMPKPHIDAYVKAERDVIPPALASRFEGPAVADIAADHEQRNPLPRLEAVAPILGKTSFYLLDY